MKANILDISVTYAEAIGFKSVLLDSNSIKKIIMYFDCLVHRGYLNVCQICLLFHWRSGQYLHFMSGVIKDIFNKNYLIFLLIIYKLPKIFLQ